MADLEGRRQRIQRLTDKIIEVAERATFVLQAASLAPKVANEEDRAEMTTEQQVIAGDALKPPKDAPFYLHAMAKIVAAGAGAITKADEAPKTQLNVQVVNVAPSVEAWQAQRRVLHDPVVRADVTRALIAEQKGDD